MKLRNLPLNIRVKLFKMVYEIETFSTTWEFMKDEWKESWEMYGWEFAFADYASKAAYWIENEEAFVQLLDKKAYKKARKRLFLR